MPTNTITRNKGTKAASMASTTSTMIKNLDKGFFGVVVPSGETGKVLTVQATFDEGATWINIKSDDGSQWSYTLTANSELVLVPPEYSTLTHFRFVLGSAISSTKNFTALLMS